MKLTPKEMALIVRKVSDSRLLTPQERDILRAMGRLNGSACPVMQIVEYLHISGWPGASHGSVKVLLHRIRKKIDGTGLYMASDRARGGGVALRYEPII